MKIKHNNYRRIISIKFITQEKKKGILLEIDKNNINISEKVERKIVSI